MDWPEALGLALVFLARFEEGQKYFDRAPADNYTRLVGEALLLSRTGKDAKIEEKVEALRRAYGDAASYQMAEVYAIMTDHDRAFAALARGIAIRDAGLLGVKTDALLDPLRNDPRFITVLRKVNFPA